MFPAVFEVFEVFEKNVLQKKLLFTVFSLSCVVIINCAKSSLGIEREQALSLENIDSADFISFLSTHNTSSLTTQITTASQLQFQNARNSWLKQSFEEHSLAWLFATSIIGGIVGASTKLIFEIILPNRLQERRKILNLTQKYSTPILLSAKALRNRLANMIKFIELVERDKWLSQEQITYYYISTIYLVSRFFGWLEILRNTVVYLDMNSLKKTRKFEQFLESIEACFSDPKFLPTASDIESRDNLSRDWCFSYELCAIGEIVIYKEENSENWKVIGFSDFNKYLFDPNKTEFNKWISFLSRIFGDLRHDEFRFKRIIVAHAVLNSFMDYMDPRHIRSEKQENFLHLLKPQEKLIVQEKIKHLLHGN